MHYLCVESDLAKPSAILLLAMEKAEIVLNWLEDFRNTA